MKLPLYEETHVHPSFLKIVITSFLHELVIFVVREKRLFSNTVFYFIRNIADILFPDQDNQCCLKNNSNSF